MRFARLPGWIGAAALVLAALLLLRHCADPVYRVPGLAGPAASLLPAAPAPASPADFAAGGPTRLAIYLTDPQSPWLGLAFGLRTIGVPFVVTTDAREAVRHRVVLAYPTISGRHVPAAASEALRAHVAGGGTLIATEVLGAGLDDVFGLAPAATPVPRLQMAWTDEAAQQWQFAEPEERVLPLGNAATPLAAYTLRPTTGQVLARFGDGAAALVRNAHGNGRSYTLAFDLGAFVSAAQQGRRNVGRDYVNAYEPVVDVLLRWLKAVYREGEPAAVTLGTVPDGRPLAVVLSHDVDYNASIRNALLYARSEAAQGIAATFFVQTKYVRDWNDERFFDADGIALVRELRQLGGELASHSVAHSPVFARLPLGDGTESYPAYAPYVASKQETRGASVMGELRISRFLLEHAAPGARIDSFRPGHLEYPFALPQALQAAGYRHSSSLAAGVALSHLPFQLSHNRDGRAAVAIHEFPITLEDERVRPMDTLLLPRALEVARKLARYGGLCVVLVHPNVLDDKLRFQEGFVTAMQGRQAWIGPLGRFAAWWRARDGVQFDVRTAGGRAVLQVQAPEAVAGLTVQLPAGWRMADASARAGAHGSVIDVPAGASEWPLEESGAGAGHALIPR